MSRLSFQLEAKASGSRARAARFRTLHNEVLTPLFMPVGTQATVKAQLPQTLEETGAQILLANTYHLLLRPGAEVFKRLGGIHKFMNWQRSVLTDSGGFQIFSLPHARSMTEEGAVFQSYLDGRSILLSPEVSIQTQVAIGSDIMMALDQCVPSTCDHATALAALEITNRWALRSLAARGDSPQSMFAIIQGALYKDLRQQSANALLEMPFDGFAIGGLAVGETRHEREDLCEFTAALMPEDKPRYLMGVGTPLDLLEAVHRGVDMFDCIIPTQVAQRGGVFTSRGYLQLRRGIYKFSELPLDPDCECPTCMRYSRAYLHHLTKCKETLGWQLLGQHNFHFYARLMREIRESILEDRFMELYRQKREILHADDLDNPVQQVVRKKKRLTSLGAYEVHIAPEGFASIKQSATGEIMHSRVEPIEEAHALYVEQSALVEKVSNAQEKELVIWDVGLGAGANAMAAIRAYESAAIDRPVRPMRVVSFENDLDALRLAFQRNELFTYLRHSGPAALLREGLWGSRQLPLKWELACGDFAEQMQGAPPPDLIFYDMFSHKTDAVQWTLELFEKLFSVCGRGRCELFTYTCSTAIRAALLAAGFHVAKGRSTGAKLETTIAVTPAALPTSHPLLGQDWLTKWERSGAKFPAQLSSQEQEAFSRRIVGHPQFGT